MQGTVPEIKKALSVMVHYQEGLFILSCCLSYDYAGVPATISNVSVASYTPVDADGIVPNIAA